MSLPTASSPSHLISSAESASRSLQSHVRYGTQRPNHTPLQLPHDYIKSNEQSLWVCNECLFLSTYLVCLSSRRTRTARQPRRQGCKIQGSPTAQAACTRTALRTRGPRMQDPRPYHKPTSQAAGTRTALRTRGPRMQDPRPYHSWLPANFLSPHLKPPVQELYCAPEDLRCETLGHTTSCLPDSF